jgi:hypothetical protein
LNNIDSAQWCKTFTPQQTSQLILPFIYQTASKQTGSPLLKAASIKMLGYMVYFEMGNVLAGLPDEEKKFKN